MSDSEELLKFYFWAEFIFLYFSELVIPKYLSITGENDHGHQRGGPLGPPERPAGRERADRGL